MKEGESIALIFLDDADVFVFVDSSDVCEHTVRNLFYEQGVFLYEFV